MTVTAEETLARWTPRVSAALERALPEAAGSLAPLHEAMRYSLHAGGKRLRPVLCLASCETAGGDPERALGAAVALELVHTYSLIHDDLPCMDDDDLRRGRPTNHKVHGEAMAVLAGDGLLTRAFGLLAEDETQPPEIRVEMVRTLAAAAGATGMVGGQALDLAAEGSEDVDLPTLQYIHTHKTGALFGAACRLGGMAAGAGGEVLSRLARFGEKTGLAFQIVDDLLDVTGRTQDLGKTSGRDRARGKATYPALLGVEASRARVAELGDSAVRLAREFGEPGAGLAALARFVMERSS